jgi:hypothetical protein
MTARNLELEILRRGRHADDIDLHADPDDVGTLRETLVGWLEGNGWSTGRWNEFELLVRYAGEYKTRRRIRTA